MRCIACNKALTEFEATRKSVNSGEYVDLCSYCYNGVNILAQEREDLRDNDEVIDFDVDDLDFE